jgi:hypothetical protein
VLAYPKGVNKKAFYYSIVERFSFGIILKMFKVNLIQKHIQKKRATH